MTWLFFPSMPPLSRLRGSLYYLSDILTRQPGGVAVGASVSWGDVKTWNAVPWTHVFPYRSAELVQSYTTTFTAQSDTLTLFIGLLRSRARATPS